MLERSLSYEETRLCIVLERSLSYEETRLCIMLERSLSYEETRGRGDEALHRVGALPLLRGDKETRRRGSASRWSAPSLIIL
ncbi:hypothetical protein EYF80_067723 [Liparis tanakae]|uniref:Uncharacterized protein n=1 Tax=Liparis tanakae TaxID=230148 RepID=A0A4Z2E068_9TELE|nr:hypothetical protein EYF80_067723 [Liparis tanakae]